MMLVSCGTQLSGTRTSSSIPTLASFVLPSTPTRGSQSTPSVIWKSTLAEGGLSAHPTSLVLLRAPTRACAMVARTSLFLLLVSLVLERPRTPRRSFHTLPPLVPLARRRRASLVLRTRLSRLTP